MDKFITKARSASATDTEARLKVCSDGGLSCFCPPATYAHMNPTVFASALQRALALMSSVSHLSLWLLCQAHAALRGKVDGIMSHISTRLNYETAAHRVHQVSLAALALSDALFSRKDVTDAVRSIV